MPRVIYEMDGVSADGYIVGPDGKFDWSEPDKVSTDFITSIRAPSSAAFRSFHEITELTWNSSGRARLARASHI
jgi:hypothetical protein